MNGRLSSLPPTSGSLGKPPPSQESGDNPGGPPDSDSPPGDPSGGCSIGPPGDPPTASVTDPPPPTATPTVTIGITSTASESLTAPEPGTAPQLDTATLTAPPTAPSTELPASASPPALVIPPTSTTPPVPAAPELGTEPPAEPPTEPQPPTASQTTTTIPSAAPPPFITAQPDTTSPKLPPTGPRLAAAPPPHIAALPSATSSTVTPPVLSEAASPSTAPPSRITPPSTATFPPTATLPPTASLPSTVSSPPATSLLPTVTPTSVLSEAPKSPSGSSKSLTSRVTAMLSRVPYLSKPVGNNTSPELDPAKEVAQHQKMLKKYGKKSPDAILRLPLETLMKIPVEILNGLPMDRVTLLPDEVLPRLSPQVLMQLPSENLSRLPLDVLNKLPSIILVKLDPFKLSELEPKTLASVLKQDPRIHQHLSRQALAQLRTLPDAEFLSLPDDVQVAVPSDDVDSDLWQPNPHPRPPDPVTFGPGESFYFEQGEPPTSPPTSSPLPNSSVPTRPTAEINLVKTLQSTLQDARLGDLKREKERLEEKVIQYEVEKRKANDDVSKFLVANQWDKHWDLYGNPLKPLYEFGLHYMAVARQNYETYVYWEKAKEKEEAQKVALQADVRELTAKLNDLRAKLHRAENEPYKLKTQLKDLQGKFQANLDARTSELRQKVEDQKYRMTEALRDQRLSHEKEARKLQAIIDGYDQKQQSTLKAQEKRHMDAVDLLNTQHAQAMERQRLAHQSEMKQIRETYDKKLEEARLAHSQTIAQRDQFHQQGVRDLEQKVISLESSLVDNSDDFRPATDDSLKTKYQQLKLAVETITFNLGPIDLSSASGLDPGRFLEREGKRGTRFLLQSLLWERLAEGFFSLPFGLGALGVGHGKGQLMNLYMEYRRLLDGELPSVPSTDIEYDSLAFFRSDMYANRWRSATFQSLIVAVTPQKYGGRAPPTPPPGSDIQTPYLENREQVHTKILAVLQQVCTKGISEEIGKTVRHLVTTAGELALELGVQRAELGLEMPERGSQVQIGQNFVDCFDGDADRGLFKEVVLAVSPRLYKRGDGRGDMRTVKVIFHGEIYTPRG